MNMKMARGGNKQEKKKSAGKICDEYISVMTRSHSSSLWHLLLVEAEFQHDLEGFRAILHPFCNSSNWFCVLCMYNMFIQESMYISVLLVVVQEHTFKLIC